MPTDPRAGAAERPADDLIRALRRLVRAIGQLEAAATQAAGLPRAQAHALLAVAAMGRPAMTMVARELGLAPSTVTRALDPLVRRGLLKRESSPDDRRVVVVAATAAGRQALERVEAALDLAYARVTAGAGPGSRKRFTARLESSLERSNRCRSSSPVQARERKARRRLGGPAASHRRRFGGAPRAARGGPH